MKVSYVITTFNRPDALEKAVGFVSRERCESSELIVVDDNSRPSAKMPEMAENAFPSAHLLIKNPANLGVIGARNAGISAAKGTFIVFLDDDDESLPNRSKDLLAHIEGTDFDFVSARALMLFGQAEKVVPSNSGFLLTPEKQLLYPSHIDATIWRREMFAGTPGLDNRVPYLGEHISQVLCLLRGGKGWLSEAVVARFSYDINGLTKQTQQQNSLKKHLTDMYRILLEESGTPAFRQLCDRVLAMLHRETIINFDDYLQHLYPIIRRFVSLH